MTATVTSKGQITIPKQIRDLLHLRSGHRVDFLVEAGGRVVMKARNKDIRMLKASLPLSRRKPVSLREMDEAIAGGAANS